MTPHQKEQSMRIFMAGATGVLGRASIPLLVNAGHSIVGVARTEEKAAGIQALGAEPALADIFDADIMADVMQGCDTVLNFATKIPRILDMGKKGAWNENDRLRSTATASLVKAARAVGATRFLQE